MLLCGERRAVLVIANWIGGTDRTRNCTRRLGMSQQPRKSSLSIHVLRDGTAGDKPRVRVNGGVASYPATDPLLVNSSLHSDKRS